jgi:addiction module RelE/StbE family toxin
MRRIERTNTFKRDYKRVKATPEHRDIDLRLSEVLKLLAADIPLPRNLYDHPLTGD